MQTPVRNYKGLLTATWMLLFGHASYAQTATSEAWVTNSSKRMEHQEAQAVEESTKASAVLTLDMQWTYQSIDGFGWMLTQGSAKLLMQLPADTRKSLIEELYGAEGLRASMVRVAIGSCDLSESNYTYSASKDETLANFAIAQQDMTTIVPILQEIMSVNPKVKVLATPWTAPVWMKDNSWNNGYAGGVLKTAYYDLYADYLIKYIDAMAAWNIPIWGISVQNEPLNGNNNPSMTWTKETMYKFITGNLGPKLRESKYSSVRIIGYDHNCDVTDFPIYVAKSKYVYGTAFHLYAGDVRALGEVYNSTGKPVLFTEQYTSKDGDFSGDLNWHVKNVVLGSLTNMASAALEWNLCSDPNYSIHTSGGCTTCMGALTISGSNVRSRNVSYYIIGHASRVIDAGAVRMAAESNTSDLTYTAALNPDGSIGVVAYSDAAQGKRLGIAFTDADGRTWYATHTLPTRGVMSVRIRPSDMTAVEHTAIMPSAVKRIEHGRLIIEHEGKRYNATGMPL